MDNHTLDNTGNKGNKGNTGNKDKSDKKENTDTLGFYGNVVANVVYHQIFRMA